MVCRSTRCCCQHRAEPAGGGHSISGGPLGHQSGHCPLQRPQQKLGSFASATAEAAVAHTKCATSQAPVVNNWSLADQTAAAHPSALPWLCVGAVASDALHLWLNSWHLEQTPAWVVHDKQGQLGKPKGTSGQCRCACFSPPPVHLPSMCHYVM